MDHDKLWTQRELAKYLDYTESTIARMITQYPEKLPPSVSALGKLRWHPEVVKQWAFDKSFDGEKSENGRPRTIT